MPENYTQYDDLASVMLEFENGAQGYVSCNRFSPVVSQSTDLWATDATNPFQSCPMAVFTNKDYNKDTLPEILVNFR